MFSENIIKITTWNFYESDFLEQHLLFSGFGSISIGFPIIMKYLGFSRKFEINRKIPWQNFRFRNFQIFEIFINIINDVPGPGKHVGVLTRPLRLEKPSKIMIFQAKINEKHNFFIVFLVRTCSVQPTMSCLPRGRRRSGP